MPKIQDLISLPVVETVIQLQKLREVNESAAPDDPAGQQYLNGLTASFVLTEDIETNLKIILESLARPQGRGFFLSGSFGSGKSHFLSILSLLLQPLKRQKQMWEPLVKQQPKLGSHFTALSKKTLLIVEIPLLAYKAARPLEEIVFEAVQNRLAKPPYKIDATLAEESYFLQQFQVHVLPLHARHLDKLVSDKYPGLTTWKRLLDKDQKAAYELTKKYLTGLDQKVPFQLALDRGEGFERLEKILAQHKIDGFVLLIDELSEFLKAKSQKTALNEDARFLQFLGERSATRPIWVVAALQEHIEKTGDIQKEVIDKIKDRYHSGLSLSTRHIKELIDYRLILKKEGSQAHLEAAYKQLKFSFNDIPLTLDAFRQIYPVHPETIELLDVCAELFSQRRGVVDFIHFQVKGDPTRNIAGILAEDYTHLLTPDRIFDHFETRLKESPAMRKYYDHYHDYFAKRISGLFPDEPSDVVYAQRLIKILMLLRLASLPSKRTIRQLANMLLYQAFTDLAGGVNYKYLAEHLVKKMTTELSYLRLTPGSSTGSGHGATELDAVLEFDLAATAVDLYADKARAIRQQAKTPEMLTALLKTINYGQLPLANFVDKPVRYHTHWMNTTRGGQVWLTDLLQVDNKAVRDFLQQLRATEDDFFLLIGLPLKTDEQQAHLTELFQQFENRFIHGVIAWLPAPFTQTELLSEWHAAHRLARDYANDATNEGREIARMAENNLERLKQPAQDELKACYQKGVFVTAAGPATGSGQGRTPFDFAVSAYKNFEDLLGLIIREPLKKLFPKHQTIETAISAQSATLVNEVIAKFIVPGKIEGLDAPHHTFLKSALEGVLLPLQLVELSRDGSKARLVVDPLKNPGIKLILEEVKKRADEA